MDLLYHKKTNKKRTKQQKNLSSIADALDARHTDFYLTIESTSISV